MKHGSFRLALLQPTITPDKAANLCAAQTLLLEGKAQGG